MPGDWHDMDKAAPPNRTGIVGIPRSPGYSPNCTAASQSMIRAFLRGRSIARSNCLKAGAFWKATHFGTAGRVMRKLRPSIMIT